MDFKYNIGNRESSLPGDRAAFSDRKRTLRHRGAKLGYGGKDNRSKCQTEMWNAVVRKMYELDIKDIKEILMEYKSIREQTRQQILDLYQDLHDTDALIEVVSIRKNRNSDMPGTKNGVGQDLSDIVLRHQRQLKNWYKEISYEIDILLGKEEMLHRLWLCYRLLPERQYRVLTVTCRRWSSGIS